MNDFETRDPVVVVGQPRSGSTVLTRVLNNGPDLFLINDFYALQFIDSNGMWGSLSSAQSRELALFVYERIEIRATQEKGMTLEQSIDLSDAQLAQVRAVAERDWPEGLTWGKVFRGVFGAAIESAGYKMWGWNTPQDHLHSGRIFAEFPKAKFVFQLRRMPAVLNSYKNASGEWHEAKRYNPVAIGLAWKAAAAKFDEISASHPQQAFFLRYEQLVSDTREMMDALASFLDIELPYVDLAELGKNSSFGAKKTALPVSPSEVAIALRMAGPAYTRLSFDVPEGTGFAIRDLPQLAQVFAISGGYIATSVLTDRDRRTRVLRLLGVRSNV